MNENKTPAAPPAGFKALEPSSFRINLAEGGDGLTLQKVDYIFDVTSKQTLPPNIVKSMFGKFGTN